MAERAPQPMIPETDEQRDFAEMINAGKIEKEALRSREAEYMAARPDDGYKSSQTRGEDEIKKAEVRALYDQKFESEAEDRMRDEADALNREFDEKVALEDHIANVDEIKMLNEADRMNAKFDADKAREKAIEDRKNSPEIQKLNDQAMFEVYGSGDRTVLRPANDTMSEEDYPTLRVITNKDGSKSEVIADKDNPLNGILADIKEEGSKELRDEAKKLREEEPINMNGRPQAERDKAKAERIKQARKLDRQATKLEKENLVKADKYEQDFLETIEKEDLEPYQALFIMDARVEDGEKKAQLVEKLKADGATLRDSQGNVVTPEQKAEQMYKFADKKRLALIKEKGIFTDEEYDLVLSSATNGKAGRKNLSNIDLYAPKAPKPPIDPKDPADPKTGVLKRKESKPMEQISVDARDALNDEASQKLLKELGLATERYVAAQSKLDVSMFSRKGDKTELENARSLYEMKRHLANNKIQEYLVSKGYSGKQITDELARQDVGNDKKYSAKFDKKDGKETVTYEADLISSGESGLIRDLSKKEIERLAGEKKFSSWFAKRNILVKGAIVVVPGIAAAAALPIVASAGAGAALAASAGFFGKRAASGAFSANLRNNAKASSEAEDRTSRRHENQQRAVRGEILAVRRRVMAETDSIKDPAEKAKAIEERQNAIYRANVNGATSEHLAGAKRSQSSNRKGVAKAGAVGLVAGAAAGAAVDAIGNMNFGGNGSGSESASNNPPASERDSSGGGSSGDRDGSGASGSGGGGESSGGSSGETGSGSGSDAETSGYHTESLSSGDNISNHALSNLQENGNSNPNQAQIIAETQRILDLNDISWDEARELNSGFSFKV